MELNVELLKQYELFLESLKLQPEFYKIKNVEMDLNGKLNPTFILNDFFFVQKKWVSFSEFYEFYITQHSLSLKNKFTISTEKNLFDGLRARLYRTQFGFLTEYHSYFLSSLLFGSENVFRSTSLDIAGVDFRIKLLNKFYNIHIFVDTNRAWQFRNYKSSNKNVNSFAGLHVNLPYSLDRKKFNSLHFLKNGFGVYTESYLRYFEKEVIIGNIKNNNIVGTNADGFIYSQ